MKYVAYTILFFGIIGLFGMGCGWFNDGLKTIQKEFAPSAMLKKYEEFKNISGAIDKHRANLEAYQSELDDLVLTKDQSQEDKFYYQQRKSEALGILAIHNDLCAQYNVQMSKFNYRFTNVGDLPQSNLEPLPREYKPFILNLKTTKK
jgi:hypothetical protein